MSRGLTSDYQTLEALFFYFRADFRILLKMPGEDVSKLVFEILKQFVNGYLLGWGLFIFSIIGWYLTARYLRRHHTKEIRRVSEEKTKYQRSWLGDVESSNQ